MVREDPPHGLDPHTDNRGYPYRCRRIDGVDAVNQAQGRNQPDAERKHRDRRRASRVPVGHRSATGSITYHGQKRGDATRAYTRQSVAHAPTRRLPSIARRDRTDTATSEIPPSGNIVMNSAGPGTCNRGQHANSTPDVSSVNSRSGWRKRGERLPRPTTEQRGRRRAGRSEDPRARH